jgi:hypothetical protein
MFSFQPATPQPVLARPTYTSKRYHYTIEYPRYWTVTPGVRNASDQYDGGGPVIYISRYVDSRTVSLSDVVKSDAAWYKRQYGAKVVASKAVKVAGYAGRLISYRGVDDDTNVAIQSLRLVKGRIVYDLSAIGEPINAKGDADFFRGIYETFKPT